MMEKKNKNPFKVIFHWFKTIFSAIAHPHNFSFCCKYPFMKMKSVWSGVFCGYSTTWYDYIPTGWKKAFGQNLLDDIVKALKEDKIPKHKWEKAVFFEDIKEKYGTLRLDCMAPEKIQKVLSKYELLSQGYCEECGEKARYVTSGWINYLCKSCYLKYFDNLKMTDEEKEESLKNDRLEEEDIPEIYRFDSNGKEEKIDILKEYNIDFRDLWGL